MSDQNDDLMEDEDTMTDDNDTTMDDDETPSSGVTEDDFDATEGGVDTDGDEVPDPEDDGETASNVVAAQITDLVASHNLPTTMAADMIRDGLSLSAAVAKITAHVKEHNPMTGKTRAGRTTARIVRDERETRRTGMTMALTAQIIGAAPESDQARPFMDMSIVEMAAEVIGHKGALRNAGARSQVFMEAGHATSDFPAIFENALNKVLLERYQLAEPTYRLVSRKRNFRDFRPMPLVRAGDFPTLQKINEKGEIQFGSFGESKEVAVLTPYGVGLNISRQMMINDDLGAIDEVLSDYGQSIADFEETSFYAFALNAQLADGNALFRTQRKNLAASGGAITIDSVSAGRQAMREQVSIDGRKLNLAPSIILAGPANETAAEQFVAAVQPNETGKVNPFSGKLQPVITPQITGNDWYLMASASRPGAACFVHGYLEGAEAPRLRTQEPFGTQGFSMTVEHDWGMGAQDYRGAYKNSGA